MIDNTIIHIKSGNGGDGAISGRHEKFVPRGGPDGGDGGTGGNIVIRGDRNKNTLLSFRYKKVFVAGNGTNGGSANKHGKDGKDVILQVPVGTLISTAKGSEIADITAHDQEILIAKGGRGGVGNSKFKSSTSQYPVIAESGDVGEEKEIVLQLKLLADVGIIGAPNAGKSSLISILTAARPKIGSYPFTTLEPVLGVCEHRGEEVVFVDIPGLIEGAHEGVGLGHEFLAHIERTKVLIHLVDASTNNPVEVFKAINEELKKFDESLIKKQQVVVLNKVDTDEVRNMSKVKLRQIAEETGSVYFISAVTGEGLESMQDEVLRVLSEETSSSDDVMEGILMDEKIPVIRPEPEDPPVAIERDADVFIVYSRSVERVAKRIDYDDWLARMQLYRYMIRKGVVRALEDAGINSGDTVRVGDLEWEWD